MKTPLVRFILPTIFILSLGSVCAQNIFAYEKVCADIGFQKGTLFFGECVLELDNRGRSQTKKVAENSNENQQCEKIGFVSGTPAFNDCRLKLEILKQETAQRRVAFLAEQQRYQEQVEAFEKEKKRQKDLARLSYGLALMGSTSPTFAGGIADANRTMGLAPPEPPKLKPFTIQGPKGMTTCLVIGDMYNCN